MKWCMNERFWIDLKCLNMYCSWDFNYAKKNDENFMLIGLLYLKKEWFEMNRSIEFEL
jgi:hypothetical protein